MKTGTIQGPAIEQVASAMRSFSMFKGLDDNQLQQAVSQAKPTRL